MSTLQDSDLFIVDRNGTNYQLRNSQMSTLQDTDLFVVERSGVNYKVEAKDVNTGGVGLQLVTLAPLSGQPEFNITATTNLSKILSGSLVTYKWYRYTASTGGTGTLLKSFESDSAISDTYTATAADQGGYVGCTVSYLGTTVTETARAQCLTAPGPIATMYGLRFDKTRETELSRTFNSVTGTGTISFWMKRAGNDQDWVFDFNAGSNRVGMKLINSGETVYIYGGDTNDINVTLEDNTWTNFVISYVSGGSLNVYVNGENKSTQPASKAPSGNLTVVFGGNISAVKYNGYLSEVYFAEQVLPPEAFGKNFDPYGWGPLDSSQIKENIGAPPLSPYDTRANTSQVWSSDTDGTVFEAQNPVTNAYDGNLTTYARVNADASPAISVFNAVNSNNIVVYGEPGDNLNGKIYIRDASGTFVDVTSQFITPGNFIERVKITGVTGISGFKLESTTSNPRIAAIEVDGRILVDQGFWNNSQNWTGDATITGSTTADAGTYGPWKYGFDGNETSFVETSSGTKLVFATPVPFSSLEMKATGTYKINDTSVTASGTSSGNAVFEIPAGITSPISSIELLSSSSILQGVKVDGAILVDAGWQWNASQNWSAGATGNFVSGYEAVNGFDGNLTTTKVIGSAYEISWTGITVNSSLRVRGDGGGANEMYLILDGAEVTVPFTASPTEWYDISFTDTPSLTGVKVVSSSCSLYAIEVNGKVLVDTGSFGASGFYLPFDPKATGVIYSSGVVTGSKPSQPWSKAFDSILSAGNYAQSPSAGTSTLTLPNPVAFSSSFKISGFCNAGATLTITGANGAIDVSSQLPTASGTYTLQNITGVTSPISAITLTGTGSSVNCGIWGIAADDVLLVDHDSIGVDDSGNKNNFHDQNFALNTTGAIYTGSYTGSPYEGTWSNVFNGVKGVNSASTVSTYASSGDTTMTLTTPFSGNLTVYASANAGTGDPTGAEVILTTGSGAVSVPCAVLATGNPAADHGISVGAVTNVTAITLKQAPKGTNLYWLEIDGTPLTDANQQDTVTDTPMMNYAVLASGVNGNLATTANTQAGTTSTLSVTGKVYAEVVPTLPSSEITVSIKNDATTVLASIANRVDFNQDDIVGVAVDESAGNVSWYVNNTFVRTDTFDTSGGVKIGGNSGNTGSTGSLIFNFGQQPFAATNVTYNQATGIATIDGNAYNTLFHTWEQSKAALFKARAEGSEERVDELEEILIRQSVPFDRDTQYPKGAIVNIRGRLFEAIVDGADVSVADFVSSFFKVKSPEWVNLDIKVPGETWDEE